LINRIKTNRLSQKGNDAFSYEENMLLEAGFRTAGLLKVLPDALHYSFSNELHLQATLYSILYTNYVATDFNAGVENLGGIS
jgi:hypothetical protein